jgi:UDPglucose 6-dehydrogenase
MSLETGKIDLSIIESVFDRVSKVNKRDDNIFIIKSTVIPGSVEKLVESYPGLNIVFSPEFLTERNAKLDFINAARIIIGGRDELVNRVELMFRDRFPHTPIIKTDVTTAQFIKYMSNCFFATKVSFMNEMKQAADVSGVDWRTAVNGFLLDGRIGNSHIDVPGHDGMMGFGGKCFPKDINAFINYFDEIGIDAKIMKAAWDKNIEVRSKHDWLDIKGAVTRKS